MRALIPIAGLMTLTACATTPEVSARDDYRNLCADCHGPAGRGDGPLAAVLPTPPADLTGLSAQNGGAFPRVYVMSTIDGYTRGRTHGVIAMPEFGDLLEGGTVMVETDEGVLTPTPERLVALADYVATLQQEE